MPGKSRLCFMDSIEYAGILFGNVKTREILYRTGSSAIFDVAVDGHWLESARDVVEALVPHGAGLIGPFLHTRLQSNERQ